MFCFLSAVDTGFALQWDFFFHVLTYIFAPKNFETLFYNSQNTCKNGLKKVALYIVFFLQSYMSLL